MTAEQRLIARIPTPIQIKDLQVEGMHLRYAMAGSGSPVVLVHGLNIGWGQWYSLIPELAKRHTVYALDLPGAGGSDKIDFLAEDAPARMERALNLALKALVPQGAVVIGHSLGAWFSFRCAFARHSSVAAIVAIDPVGFSRELPSRFRPLAFRMVAKLLARIVVAPTRKNIEMFLADVMVERGNVWPEYVDYVTEHVNRPPVTHPFLLIHRLSRPFRFRDEFMLPTDRLAALNIPIAFIHGDRDPLIPLSGVREVYGRLPQAALHVVEGSGHVPPIEKPEETLRVIEAFISSPNRA